MAAVTGAQVKTLHQAGEGQIVELLQISDVTSGDTIDVGSLGAVAYKKVEAAAFFGRAQGTAVLASVTGTVITLTSAGMADDNVALLVLGEA